MLIQFRTFKHSNYISITIKICILRMLFWRYHEECENSKNQMPVKNTSYIVSRNFYRSGQISETKI